ncbi:sugar phosphate isomerase/epimerase family protein [Maribacter algicola]|uniref:Sugar phosphate isomerase/epimerase family protein n=1 Tax=Meishania litoralis TaxID=3434685 RepID=A0ACC7LI01_9FLAO
MDKKTISRRSFIGKTSLVATGASLVGPSLFGAPAILKNYGKPNSKINGVQIGVITYSFRSMEDQSAEATLQYILDCGVSAIELIGDPAEVFAGRPENPIDMNKMWGLRRKKRDEELTEDEQKELDDLSAQQKDYDSRVSEWRKSDHKDKFAEFRKMYNDAGVDIYAFKPRNTFGLENSDHDIEWGMRMAKVLGADHVTVEHPSDDAHTLRLGKLAKKHGVYIAYHGHEQQTPTLWDTALEQSNYNALNLDLGHYVAAGNDTPLDIVRAKHDRIKSMHLKDRQTPQNNKGNLSWGTGDTPIAEALQLMRDKKYTFPGTIELEYKVPEGSNAVEEVKKCLEYCEKALK